MRTLAITTKTPNVEFLTTCQINMATLEVRRHELAMRKMEMEQQQQTVVLMNLHMQLSNMQRQLDRAELQAKTYVQSYDPNHILWKTVHQQEEAIDNMNKKINELVAEVETGKNKRKFDDDDDVVECTPKPNPPSVSNVSVDDDNNKIRNVDEDLSDSNCVNVEVFNDQRRRQP
jgi:hypothetical protein